MPCEAAFDYSLEECDGAILALSLALPDGLEPNELDVDICDKLVKIRCLGAAICTPEPLVIELPKVVIPMKTPSPIFKANGRQLVIELPLQNANGSVATTDLMPCWPRNLSEAEYEDRMPTHIVWGEVESGPSTSGLSSSEHAYVEHVAQTRSRKKKLKNKSINCRQQGRQGLQYIEFRNRSEDSASNGVLTPKEASEDDARSASKNKGAAGDEEGGAMSEGEETLQSRSQAKVDYSHLSSAELEELIANVRLNEDGLPTSVGSAGHDTGECRPCLFVQTKNGCQNGVLCPFCHFPHKKNNKARPNKGKRARYIKSLKQMEESGQLDTQSGKPPSQRELFSQAQSLMKAKKAARNIEPPPLDQSFCAA
jgi:hypothetical protein